MVQSRPQTNTVGLCLEHFARGYESRNKNREICEMARNLVDFILAQHPEFSSTHINSHTQNILRLKVSTFISQKISSSPLLLRFNALNLIKELREIIYPEIIVVRTKIFDATRTNQAA